MGATMRRKFELLGSGIIMILIMMHGSYAYAQCKPGDILVSEDENYYYCTESHNRKKVEESVRAIEAAASVPGCAGGDLCNFFVATIGETRNIPYFRDVFYPGKKKNVVGGPDEGRRANDIYGFIEKAVASRASGWKKLAPEEAQELVNQGKFVIGVARNIDPAKSGHIAIVVPAWMSKRQVNDEGAGPWVRDSQSPHVSVRAGVHRFVSPSLTLPIWAVWVGD
jgi:hypothetical protein